MATNKSNYVNPFKPGAGHSPPYLAGRDAEKNEFRRLLQQTTILQNMVLTGLRGVGKTVLLEELKPIAFKEKWAWVGTDLSESTSVSEDTLAHRLITDLAVVTSGIVINKQERSMGFMSDLQENRLTYNALIQLYREAPGLVSDKLKTLLNFVWECMKGGTIRGVVFAYDEAQTMADHAEKEQYPLSLLLDVFQSIQKSNIPFMLVLVGLPTLFPKLVEARTFTERMFDVQLLKRLSREDSKHAITRPISKSGSTVHFTERTIDMIIEDSGGYPYFIQFICKEVFDIFLQNMDSQGNTTPVPRHEIIQKLDKDFFAGRWSRATDRQRQLLAIIANLANSDDEFTVQDIVVASKNGLNPFSSSHVNQMLATLGDAGLIYKNRHGKYAFAVPLMGQFIKRQEKELEQPGLPGL